MADVSRAAEEIGYVPLVPFSEGLRRLVEHVEREESAGRVPAG
jgi:nucleoside-diphosphate-sugar epimerase